jgi:hypothetical protein
VIVGHFPLLGTRVAVPMFNVMWRQLYAQKSSSVEGDKVDVWQTLYDKAVSGSVTRVVGRTGSG